MSGSALCDGDGGGMLLRFLPHRRWLVDPYHPGRTSLPQEVMKHMEQNQMDGNHFDYDDKMPHMGIKKSDVDTGSYRRC